MATREDMIDSMAIKGHRDGFGGLWMNGSQYFDSIEMNRMKDSIKESTLANDGLKLEPGSSVLLFSKL
jgi:hypothetical protein